MVGGDVTLWSCFQWCCGMEQVPCHGVGLEQCCEMGWRWRGVGDGEVWLIVMFCFRSASRSVVGWSRYPAIGVGWSNAERLVGDGQVW